jgi:hypothetical protein
MHGFDIDGMKVFVAEQLTGAPSICILDKDNKTTHVEKNMEIMNSSKGNEASAIFELKKIKRNLDTFRPVLSHTMNILIKMCNSYFQTKDLIMKPRQVLDKSYQECLYCKMHSRNI